MDIGDLEGKRFRKRLMGLDPGDVDAFLLDVSEELRQLREENANLKKDVQTLE